MEDILKKHSNKLTSCMPQVKRYADNLNALTTWWDKVALIGKLNSHNVASIILDDLHQTKVKFRDFQSTLLGHLLFEQFKKVIVGSSAKSQVTIDIIIRNLFERTADIGFLATDDDIRRFLLEKKTDNQRLFIKNRLDEYVKKYSVYDEVVILDPKGNVLANLNEENNITYCKSELLQKTLDTKEDYVETFGYSDIRPNKVHSLIYSYKITKNNDKQSAVIGILCLCFRFNNEMESIFNHFSDNSNNILLLMNEENKVISSSNPELIAINTPFSFNEKPQLLTYLSQGFLVSCSRSNGYQGFSGLGWWAMAMTPLNSAFPETAEEIAKISTNINGSALFSNVLKDIYITSKIINDDLSLVVLNGQITSLKQNAAEFMPVLEVIKQIGESTASIFSDSINNLQSIVISSYMNDASFMAALAVNIMDRNLYERANDCRWWALTSVFQETLAQPNISSDEQQKITETLIYINNLYTVYTNLYIFDTNEIIIAVSNINETHLIGKKLEGSSGATEALKLENSQQYSVSDFIKTPLYENRPTYIYNAAIKENNKILGGIGIVFDSEPELSAMLYDTLPKNEKGDTRDDCFGMFVDSSANIIAVTKNSLLQVGDILDLPSYLFTLKPETKVAEAHFLNDKEYIVGIAASSGYREYKTIGDYKNDILAFMFIPV